MRDRGAYVINLEVQHAVRLHAGALGHVLLPAGRYAYIGSARGGIAARIARHKRLAERKAGKLHWHVDHVLAHPEVAWIGGKALPEKSECAVSQRIASLKGVTVPVPRFGASDCRSGCAAHFYRLRGKSNCQGPSRKALGNPSATDMRGEKENG